MENQCRKKNEMQTSWYSRGYLPHFDGNSVPQMLTFRLIDSFPEQCLSEWKDELAVLPRAEAELIRRMRIDEYLDKGKGSAWLSQVEVAELVQTALRFHDNERYRLHSWVVMPNHVHVLITPDSRWSLAQIVHSWKSYTANKANKLIGRVGPFWQREHFDRFIRDEEHFEATVKYIEYNPVKASLCMTPIEWRFSSAAVET